MDTSANSEPMTFTNRRCPWPTCQWTWLVLDGSVPSSEIFGSVLGDHVKAEHEGHMPALRFLAEFFGTPL